MKFWICFACILIEGATMASASSTESNKISDVINHTNYAGAPKRSSLAFMTAGFIGVQASAVYINRNNDDWTDDGHRFSDGFTRAPVWDDDIWYYNYVLHPWVGSEYYLAMRNRGGSRMKSFGYSTAMSTFYEYAVENLIQQPSANDLLITPIVGSLLGEARYMLKEKIRTAPSPIWGAQAWIAVLDPVDISVGGYPDGQIRLYLNWRKDF